MRDAMIARTTLQKFNIERVIPRESLDKTFNRSGLCAYCNRKFGCVLSNDYGLVFDCEDYDPSDCDVPVITFSTLALSSDSDEWDDDSGLCHNCQKRDFCQLKKINGGVWHCVEFA